MFGELEALREYPSEAMSPSRRSSGPVSAAQFARRTPHRSVQRSGAAYPGITARESLRTGSSPPTTLVPPPNGTTACDSRNVVQDNRRGVLPLGPPGSNTASGILDTGVLAPQQVWEWTCRRRAAAGAIGGAGYSVPTCAPARRSLPPAGRTGAAAPARGQFRLPRVT